MSNSHLIMNEKLMLDNLMIITLSSVTYFNPHFIVTV